MLTKVLPTLFAISLLGTTSVAQTAMERAKAASGSAVNLNDTFKDATVGKVVTPFETASPEEAGMSHTTFEDRIVETRDADNDQGRVLRATEESKKIRPKVTIDGKGPLFDAANKAHTDADKIAGKYFTSETGQCTTPQIPVSNVTDEFCESLPAREEKTCELIRKITVDRTDTYRCDIRAANFKQVCQRTNNYTCKVNNGRNACIRNNVRFTGGRVSWSGNRATITFPRPGPVSAPVVQPGAAHSIPRNRSARWAALVKRSFSISISDRFQPSSVFIRRVTSRGVLQLTRNGRPISTFANSTQSLFGPSRFQRGCPESDTDGLLVALSENMADVPSLPSNFFALIMKYPPTLVNWFSGPRLPFPNNTGPTVFQTGYDVPNGIGPFWYTILRPARWQCQTYADLEQNLSFSRNVARSISLNTHSSANPTSGKRYRRNDMVARVAYKVGEHRAGEASVTFEFEGNCCDSFENTGSEVCQ